jgi:hypothetical protein
LGALKQGRICLKLNTVSIMEFRNGKVVHETQYFGLRSGSADRVTPR